MTKGVFKASSHKEGEVTYQIFVTFKRDADFKLILNFKKNIEHVHFKTHGLKGILNLIRLGYIIVSLDIKDEYCPVPVEENSLKFLYSSG